MNENIILFYSSQQFILLPAIGFLKENGSMYFNLSWLIFGLNIRLWDCKDK